MFSFDQVKDFAEIFMLLCGIIKFIYSFGLLRNYFAHIYYKYDAIDRVKVKKNKITIIKCKDYTAYIYEFN